MKESYSQVIELTDVKLETFKGNFAFYFETLSFLN